MGTHYGSLEQWRALQAVVDFGGYAQAAEKLYRSQSTISYAINRLEQQLGISLLEVQGRKAVLTAEGETMLARSRQLLQQAEDIGQLASNLKLGREAELQLVVDAAFPTAVLMSALKQFATHSEGTRVQLKEVVLSGGPDALLAGTADLAITGRVPADYLGEWLLDVEFIAVAHPKHVLHQSEQPLQLADLRQSLQIVIRDSGTQHKIDSGWLGAEQRWTVTSIDSAVEVITAGLGFGWLPVHRVDKLVAAGGLKYLRLAEGQRYHAGMYLVSGKAGQNGPASTQLSAFIKDAATHFNKG